MLDLEQARLAAFASINEIGCERAGIINAHGRVLRESITVRADFSPANVAAESGYAASARDTIGATSEKPVSLGVLSGSTSSFRRLREGTVVCVDKGDPLPAGADVVIPTAQSFRPDGEAQVLVLAELRPGDNVDTLSDGIEQGQIVLREGTVIGPREMAVLASVDKPGVTVSRRPRIAVVTTGDKVVELLENIAPGQIRNSARYEMTGMVLSMGCELGRLIHVTDGRPGIERAIKDCSGSDATLIALAKGDKHDAAVKGLANCGEVIFDRIHIAPGSATAFCTVNGKPVFIVPSSALLETFEAIIRPALLALLGRKDAERPVVSAIMQESMKFSLGYSNYVRAYTYRDKGRYKVRPLASRASGAAPWIHPNSMIIIPSEVDSVKRGESVEVRLLVD